MSLVMQCRWHVLRASRMLDALSGSPVGGWANRTILVSAQWCMLCDACCVPMYRVACCMAYAACPPSMAPPEALDGRMVSLLSMSNQLLGCCARQLADKSPAVLHDQEYSCVADCGGWLRVSALSC